MLASRIDGNVGLLGDDYRGYFTVGDSEGLANSLQQLRDDPARLAYLQQQCSVRSELFSLARESASLHTLVAELLTSQPTGRSTACTPS